MVTPNPIFRRVINESPNFRAVPRSSRASRIERLIDISVERVRELWENSAIRRINNCVHVFKV